MNKPDAWRAEPEAAGHRVDLYLARRYKVARNRVAGWIRDGLVTLDGKEAKASTRLEGGEAVECVPRPLSQPDLKPEAGPLAILYEDESIVALDKPSGIVVHPGAGREAGTLVHRLLSRYPETASVGGPGRPGVVHRLDRGTTGVLVVARTAAAYEGLTAAFAKRRVGKKYLAVVYGRPDPEEGRIELPIGRHPRRRKEMSVLPAGRPAQSDYRTVASAAGITLLELSIATGRTHQIRVHCRAIGRPIVGDSVYGADIWKSLPGRVRPPLRGFPRPALHAWKLELDHPVTGEKMLFEAPVPADLVELWEAVTETAVPELP